MNHSLSIFLSSNKNKIISIAFLLAGVLSGLFIPSLTDLPLKWSVGIFFGVAVFAVSLFLGNLRSVFLVLLILGIPISYVFHLTYREGHIGVADGIVISVPTICLTFLIIIWGYQIMIERKNKILFFPETTVPILFMLLAGLLSFLHSGDKILSTFGIISYIEIFIFYFYLVNNINNRQDLKLILFSLQLCLLIFSSVCILETILKTNFTASFKVLDYESDLGVFRAAGLTGSATYAGGFLASLLPLVFIQIFMTRNKIIRLMIFILSMMGMLALILTLTRGAWLALAITAVFLAFLLYRYLFVKIRYIVPIMVTLLIMLFIFQGIIFERASEGTVNLINRGHLMQTAWNMIKQYPLTGIGLNTYSTVMEKYTSIYVPHGWIHQVHNKYLLIWAETGIVGLVSFLWLLLVSLSKLFKLVHAKDPFFSSLAIGLLGSFITIIIHMNFESYAGGNIVLQFWLIIAMIAGLGRVQEQNSAGSGNIEHEKF